jgi:hypothetical protein
LHKKVLGAHFFIVRIIVKRVLQFVLLDLLLPAAGVADDE